MYLIWYEKTELINSYLASETFSCPSHNNYIATHQTFSVNLWICACNRIVQLLIDSIVLHNIVQPTLTPLTCDGPLQLLTLWKKHIFYICV